MEPLTVRQPPKPHELALTAVQRQLLDAIVAYVAEHGYPPSVREMAAAIDRSLNTTHYQLGELEWKGRLFREPGRPRAMRVIHLEAVDE